MNPSEYQKLAMRTECDQIKSRERYKCHYAPDPIRMNHAVLGLANEVGELSSIMVKWLHYGQPYPLDRVKEEVGEELGDLLWFVAQMCEATGLDILQLMIQNLAKLKARYPNKFTTELSKEENRDRNKEKVWAHDVEKRQRSLPKEKSNARELDTSKVEEWEKQPINFVCQACQGTKTVIVMGSGGRPSHQEDCPICLRRGIEETIEKMKQGPMINKQKLAEYEKERGYPPGSLTTPITPPHEVDNHGFGHMVYPEEKEELDKLQREVTLLYMWNDACSCQDATPGKRCIHCETRHEELKPRENRIRELLDKRKDDDSKSKDF